MRLPPRVLELIRELRRRGVLQAAAVYATGAFVAVQVAANVFPALQLPQWSQSLVVIAAIAGMPVVVAVWWAYEITPQGIRRTVEEEEGAEVLRARGTPRTAILLVALVTVASVGVGWVAWDLWLDTGSETPAASNRDGRPTVDEPLPLHRVMVLPFEDLTPDASLGPVAAGISNDLAHWLDQIDTLTVVSERGMRDYAGSELPLDSVARDLRVGSVVTGSVERLGDSIRLRIQLVDGRTADKRMSREFVGHRQAVLALRRPLTEAAVRALRRQIGEDLELVQQRAETTSRLAWEDFHQAENRVVRGDSLRYAGAADLAERQYRRADSLYAAAREEDPAWLAPRVGRGWLAFRRARLTSFAFSKTDPRWLRTGIERAEAILEERPGHAAALELRGVLRSFLSQVPGVDSAASLRRRAQEDLEAAVGAEPDRARAWAELADILRASGRHEEARAAWEEARKADAFLSNDADVLRLGAHLFVETGELERALELAAKGRRRYPKQAMFVELELLSLPQPDASRVSPDTLWGIHRHYVELGGLMPVSEMLVAATLARTGYEDSARSVLERVRRSLPDGQRPHAAYYEPKVWLNLGDRDRAVRLLRQAVETYDGYTRSYVAGDAWWEPLHGDSAFQALVSGPDGG